jgi:hypothetical protein
VTDEELVLLARQGDTGAFDELVVRHHARTSIAPTAIADRTGEAHP